MATSVSTNDSAADSSSSSTSIDEYKACQLAEWYPTFAQPLVGRKKGVTLKSTIVPVPPTFAEYLSQDGVQLPTGTRLSSCLGIGSGGDRNRGSSNNEDEDAWSSDSDDDGQSPRPVAIDLEDLTRRLEAEIANLGGSVLPKTNWSAPRDAAWMNEGTLKCQTAGDVYLLLQSSDFINSDVQLLQERRRQQQQQALSSLTRTADLHIVLRKWCQLHNSHEFRCFVRHRRLVAISQRQTDHYFEHLVKDGHDIPFMIGEFFEEAVKQRYANGRVGNYVMDVYVDRQDRVWIVDFNIWSSRTDSLLFAWDELNEWPDDKEMEFRIIETAKEILPQSLNNFRAPIDTVHLAALTGASPDKFQAFMDLCERPSAIYDSDGVSE